MSDIKVNSISGLSGANGPVISGTTEMNSTGAMTLPRGDTAFRDGRMGRGVFGGRNSYRTLSIQYIQISTTGNSQDFGDLTFGRGGAGAVGSTIRGIFAGGDGAYPTNVGVNNIDYVTISSTGNAADFGDLRDKKTQIFGVSNNVHGIFGGGRFLPATDYANMDYVNIASAGNSLNFGDLVHGRFHVRAAGSPTRGLIPGGSTPGPTNHKEIQYITIASKGDSLDFGDLSTKVRQQGVVSSHTRCLSAGGATPGITNRIERITIASLGDALDFGALAYSYNDGGSHNSIKKVGGAVSNSIRGVFAGGEVPGSPGTQQVIDYVTIATLGNSLLFGDLDAKADELGACSDAHGGIG